MGASLSAEAQQPARQFPMGQLDDEATRFLASAVHLDDVLADVLIDEFLGEPKRAIPPSPGVRAEVVLGEALVAQSRRRTINTILLVLITMLTVIAFPLVVAWLVSGLVWRFFSVVVTRVALATSDSRFANALATNRQRWWATAFLWSLLSIVWISIPAFVLIPVAMASSDKSTVSSIGAALFIMGLGVLTIAMYGALVAKQYLPRRTVDIWYSFGNYPANVPPRKSLVKACRRYSDRLQRIAHNGTRRNQRNSGEVVVYRGGNPFVGAGIRARSWSAAIELRPRSTDSEGPIPRFEPHDLYQFVSEDLATLRKAPHLTPGQRFADLRITNFAVLSANSLPYIPEAGHLLAQLTAGMDPELTEENWRDLANQPPEWLRYYQCFRLEGWSRQLAVSGFLHVGCDERILVLEWFGFVLPPIAPEHRLVDLPPTWLELRAMWKALADFALLPTTVPTRLMDVVRGMRDTARVSGGNWATPTQAAQVFGSAASMRELGAGTRLNTLLQISDSDRYLKILERRVVHAIHRFLESVGLSAAEFDEIVKQINVYTVFNNSEINAGNIGGQGNTGTMSVNTSDTVNSTE
ncbi:MULTISPECIES: hypothetical protein [unclassified Nocardia]|uniref:hypothetical protein n=1 Tax=unclassified Nocardia TaxID=2637762 RepID=UPI001CE47314|nr:MULTISPECIES: hypothetical protein [unclassified Nocardia]